MLRLPAVFPVFTYWKIASNNLTAKMNVAPICIPGVKILKTRTSFSSCTWIKLANPDEIRNRHPQLVRHIDLGFFCEWWSSRKCAKTDMRNNSEGLYVLMSMRKYLFSRYVSVSTAVNLALTCCGLGCYLTAPSTQMISNKRSFAE